MSDLRVLGHVRSAGRGFGEEFGLDVADGAYGCADFPGEGVGHLGDEGVDFGLCLRVGFGFGGESVAAAFVLAERAGDAPAGRVPVEVEAGEGGDGGGG